MSMRPLIAAGVLVSIMTFAIAEQPEPNSQSGKRPAARNAAEAFVERMLNLDADDNGKLSREEVTDSRLKPLFDRADSDKDGVVTKEELTELHKKEAPKGVTRIQGAGRFGRDAGQPGGGRPPVMNGRGRGGPQQVGPPQAGQVLPGFVRDSLELTDEQRKQVDALQKDVDDRLDKILTEEQKQKLRQARDRGPRPGGPPPPNDGAPAKP